VYSSLSLFYALETIAAIEMY